MPIDIERVVGAEFGQTNVSWGADQVILYHLGIGAGNPPIAPDELALCYEGGDGLRVMPTFATIPAFGSMSGFATLPGVDVNLATLLHGEHEVELARRVPVEAQATNVSRVIGVYDKGKGALLEVETVTAAGGAPLFTNRARLFLRGEGGFGGDPGPAGSTVVPDRDPDLTVETPTLPQQALLYRLSGDRNPLHADPGFAALGGFERPILHGLCSFGIVLKALVDGALEGNPESVRRYRGRFAGIVYPGETIETSIWQRDGGGFVLEASTKERGSPVLAHGMVELSG